MATKKKSSNMLGSWAFLIGVVLAIVIGLIPTTASPALMWLLVVIGLVIGFLNVSEEESSRFMMSGIILILASALGQGVLEIISPVANILITLMQIFVPATIVVAIRNVFSIARR